MGFVHPREILDFWFGAGAGKWFAKDDAFDAEIRCRFSAAHVDASNGRLDDWCADAQGALALVLVLDQFSRNLYRDDHRAFLQDAKALGVSEAAITRHFDVETPEVMRKWFYMPFLHAENLDVQLRGLEFFRTRLNDPETLRFAELHADIVRQFGRFPHRNSVLGRETTLVEQSYLDLGGFAG